MLINKRISLLLLCLVGFVFFSCKKEIGFPSSEITEPITNARFQTGDTILVKGSASDESLRKVELTIVDAGFNPVQSALNVSFTGTEVSFTRELIIQNLDLESGIYHVRLRAWNEENYASSFQQIYIEGIPKVREGWFVAVSDSLSTRGYRYDFDGATHLIFNSAEDFSGMAAWPKEKMVAFSSRSNGPLVFYDKNNLNALYTEVGPPPFAGIIFNELRNTSGGLAVLYGNGNVSLKNKMGNNVLNMTLPTSYIPNEVVTLGDEMFVFAKKQGLTNTLFKYSGITGQLLNQYNLGVFEVETSFEDDGFVLAFGTENGVAKIYKILRAGGLVPQLPLPNLKLLDAVYVREGYYLLALEDGLYEFDVNSQFLQKVNGVNFIPSNLVYDNLNNELIASSGINLRVYNLDNWSLIRTKNMPLKIVEIDVAYNR